MVDLTAGEQGVEVFPHYWAAEGEAEDFVYDLGRKTK
jgi:hypothetical protein